MGESLCHCLVCGKREITVVAISGIYGSMILWFLLCRHR